MDGWAETRTVDEQIKVWQQELVEAEAAITRLRARQVELIRKLDRFQVDCGDGARTMGDWTSARLDLSYQTASRLTQLAHASDSEIDQAMTEGRWGLDRAAALVRLRHAGLQADQFTDVAANYSLGRLYGLLDRLRHQPRRRVRPVRISLSGDPTLFGRRGLQTVGTTTRHRWPHHRKSVIPEGD